ncbi:hypothetical protein HYV84_05205 [Candidatus Woesearchaeota archaeon]|nr:hypothetical protein [Candidatus Woesearchaeota archaeon]
MASGVPLCDPAFEGYLVNSFIDQRVRPYLTKQELFPLRKYWVGEKKGGIVDILLGDVPSDVAYPKPIGDGKARGIEIALCALSPGNKDYSLEDLAEVFGVSSVDPNNLGLAQYSGTIPFGVVREVYRRVAEKVISLATKKGFSTELQPLAVKVNKTVYVFTGRAQQQYLDEYGLGELTRECVNHVLEELGDPLELSDKKIVTKSMVFAVKPGRRIIGVNIKLNDMD